jgi:hypothetical protein
VTGRLEATSARPACPRQTEPSAKAIATDTPGMPYFARSSSRRASRAARSSGVALATPRGGRLAAGVGPGTLLAGGVGEGSDGAADGGSVARGVVLGRGSEVARAGELARADAPGTPGADDDGDAPRQPAMTTPATASARSRRPTARFTGDGSATW